MHLDGSAEANRKAWRGARTEGSRRNGQSDPFGRLEGGFFPLLADRSEHEAKYPKAVSDDSRLGEGF